MKLECKQLGYHTEVSFNSSGTQHKSHSRTEDWITEMPQCMSSITMTPLLRSLNCHKLSKENTVAAMCVRWRNIENNETENNSVITWNRDEPADKQLLPSFGTQGFDFIFLDELTASELLYLPVQVTDVPHCHTHRSRCWHPHTHPLCSHTVCGLQTAFTLRQVPPVRLPLVLWWHSEKRWFTHKIGDVTTPMASHTNSVNGVSRTYSNFANHNWLKHSHKDRQTLHYLTLITIRRFLVQECAAYGWS